STLITGDVAEQITGLKRQPGKDIAIIGSPTLMRSLLGDGLLDRLNLYVFPVVLGAGKRLFEEGISELPLELVDSRAYKTGVVSLAYAPARS
ncbi:MAG: dihydrofolate reductase, partial [Actinobacteria bacterium]